MRGRVCRRPSGGGVANGSAAASTVITRVGGHKGRMAHPVGVRGSLICRSAILGS